MQCSDQSLDAQPKIQVNNGLQVDLTLINTSISLCKSGLKYKDFAGFKMKREENCV